MRCESFLGDLVESACDCLVVGIDEAWRESAEIREINAAMDGLLGQLIEAEEISTKPMKITQIVAPAGVKAKQLIAVGLGDRKSVLPSVYSRAAAAALKTAASKKRSLVRVVGFQGTPIVMRGAVSGAMVGCVAKTSFEKKNRYFSRTVSSGLASTKTP